MLWLLWFHGCWFHVCVLKQVGVMSLPSGMLVSLTNLVLTNLVILDGPAAETEALNSMAQQVWAFSFGRSVQAGRLGGLMRAHREGGGGLT